MFTNYINPISVIVELNSLGFEPGVQGDGPWKMVLEINLHVFFYKQSKFRKQTRICLTHNFIFSRFTQA